MFEQVEIPYGCYSSTPFVRWQGALQHLHAVRLAAHVASRELDKRNIDEDTLADDRAAGDTAMALVLSVDSD
jgi:acetyl-CoA acetyltransferase